MLGGPARLYARCAVEDRAALLGPVERLGAPVTFVPGRSTTSFRIDYDGERRLMEVAAAGDSWLPEDLPELPAEVRWVHVAPLLRSDFPAETLARLARGRRLALDGQGLVRVPALGELRLDADYDPELLRHVSMLKLADEEAEVVGDPASLGVPEVVVTHGLHGATVLVDGCAEEVHAIPVDTDPTGAGDAFSTAYVSGRARGLPPLAAARAAAALVSEMLSRR